MRIRITDPAGLHPEGPQVSRDARTSGPLISFIMQETKVSERVARAALTVLRESPPGLRLGLSFPRLSREIEILR